jgi:hypothetical protein
MGNVQYPARSSNGLRVDPIGRQIYRFTGVEMIFAAYPIVEDAVSLDKCNSKFLQQISIHHRRPT